VKQVIIFILFVTCLECNAFAQGKKKQKKIDAVVAEAHSFIGTPYQYGGIGYGGIDCSGLICNSLKAIDVNMPRVSVDQSKVGSKKNWKSIRPGDLVFFKFITSVGENEIKFIHASSSRGVVESNLNESYYRENVKKFRRVIK
jgi:probable lipoprotein NlpC